MIVAVIVLAAVVIGQFMLIMALLNRVLVQAKIAPIVLPKTEREEEAPTPQPRRKLFSLRVVD